VTDTLVPKNLNRNDAKGGIFKEPGKKLKRSRASLPIHPRHPPKASDARCTKYESESTEHKNEKYRPRKAQSIRAGSIVSTSRLWSVVMRMLRVSAVRQVVMASPEIMVITGIWWSSRVSGARRAGRLSWAVRVELL